MKHTKGKWTVLKAFGKIYIRTTKRDIAVLQEDDKSEDSANAKLIAAAPELLEALIRVFNSHKDSGREGCTYGDTDYDSISYVEGYNQCIENMKEIVKSAIEKATK